MSAVATFLARRIPVLGGLLLVAAGFGFLLQFLNGRPDLDGIYAVLLLIHSLFCILRRRAIEEPGRCRVLLIVTLVLTLLGQSLRLVFVNMSAPWNATWIIYTLTTYAFYLGVVGLLGGTLALRDNPDNESARRIRRRASVTTFIGFGLLLLSEVFKLFALRFGMSSIAAGASVFTIFVVLIRGCLAAGAILVLLRPVEGDAMYRREAVILKTLVASVAFGILAWVAFFFVVVFQLMPGLHDSGRYLWLNAVYLLLMLLSIALVPVAMRKPESAGAGYNSPSGTNSSGGAEA